MEFLNVLWGGKKKSREDEKPNSPSVIFRDRTELGVHVEIKRDVLEKFLNLPDGFYLDYVSGGGYPNYYTSLTIKPSTEVVSATDYEKYKKGIGVIEQRFSVVADSVNQE